MKGKIAVLILAIALLVGCGFAEFIDMEEEAHADATFSFNLFFDSLAPYGSWVPVDGYGYGWYPTQTGPGWQPYVDGQWAWSDQGWTWISYEPWGWATYHYGRWIYDPYYGWLWIPGTVWAPAWVSWYQAPGYVGWSPLPPDNNFFIEIGFSFVNYGYGYNGGYYGGNGWGYNGGHNHYYHGQGHYYDNDYYAPGDHCVFVPQDKFTYKNAKLVALEGPDRLTVMRNVRNVTDIQVQNNKIYNYGPDKGGIERAEGGKFRRVDLVDSSLTNIRGNRDPNSLNGNRYSVFRPSIEKKEGDAPYTMRDVNGSGVKRRYTSGDATTGNALDKERNTVARESNPSGNDTPSNYGIIKRGSLSLKNGLKLNNESGRQSGGETIAPMNQRATGNVSPAVSNGSNSRYDVPSSNSQPIRTSTGTDPTGKQGNYYRSPAVQMDTGTSNQSKYRQPDRRNTINYSAPGNYGRTPNRSIQQPVNNHSSNGYNVQKYPNVQRPVQNQNRNSSNIGAPNGGSGNNRYSNSTTRSNTSPPRNTGNRSYNPGNTKSSNNNSFVQDSAHGR